MPYEIPAVPCTQDDRPILKDHHRPELEDDKFPALEAVSSLPEQNWAAAIERNGNRGDHKKRPKARYRDHAANDVERPLQGALNPSLWTGEVGR
jgi:hypothetical protein